jgi:hypothetical protein
MNVDQTIVGWKDLMAMGVISPDWSAMPQQEAAEEEKELGKLKTHMLKKYNTVFSDTINETPSPPRNIAARTPLPPTVIEAQNDPFTSDADPLHVHMMSWQVDADAEAEEALIHYGSAVTQEDRDA